MPLVGEQPHQPVAEQGLVLDHDHAHGSFAVSRVPAPGAESTVRLPPWARARSIRPSSPLPRRLSAPPVPSSSTVSTRSPCSRANARTTRRADACLTAFVSPSQAMKYAAASSSLANRSGASRTSTGIGERAASSRSAEPSPWSSDAGRSPRPARAARRSRCPARPRRRRGCGRPRGGALPLSACWACRDPVRSTPAAAGRRRGGPGRAGDAPRRPRRRSGPRLSSSCSRRRSSTCSAAISSASRPASRTSATSCSSVSRWRTRVTTWCPVSTAVIASARRRRQLPRPPLHVVRRALRPEADRQVVVVNGCAHRALPRGRRRPRRAAAGRRSRSSPGGTRTGPGGTAGPPGSGSGCATAERDRHDERPSGGGERRGDERPDGEHDAGVGPAEHRGDAP